MEYRDLYNFSLSAMEAAQALGAPRPISFYEIKPLLIQRIGWIDTINVHGVECRDDDPYGHYECHGNQTSRWDDPDSWVVLITYDNSLNFCQRRFVWFKEVMHVFDDENSNTSSREAYFELLSDIETRPLNPSPAYFSEVTAKWMALLVMCPKPFRDSAAQRVADEEATHYQIALEFRIPEVIVASLVSENYNKAHEALLK